MINPSTKKKIRRAVAAYLALNLLAQYFIPVSAFALTGGPSQPEVESFEPVSTTEMVNTFTGDFNYNIPLLTVPGPNGGYPVNLAYHAGVGMEQEASWVGLGWNINPGVINRNMRGLPDDFDGDKVKKTMYYKPQETWAMDYTNFDIARPISSSTVTTVTVPQLHHSTTTPEKTEWFGLDHSINIPPNFFYQVHYNNYRGIGYGISLNLTTSMSEATSGKFSSALKISYDTDGGLGLTPSLSYNKTHEDENQAYTLSLGYNSREGVQKLSLTTAKSVTQKTTLDRFTKTNSDKLGFRFTTNTVERIGYFTQTGPGSGVTFSSSSSIPQNQLSAQGYNIRFGVTIGEPDGIADEFKKYQKRRFDLSYTESESAEIDQSFDGYGYMYLQDSRTDPNYLLDFNREKDAPANKNASNLQTVYSTSDIMLVSGQGISGSFKPMRSEIAPFNNASVVNEFPGSLQSVEFGTNPTTGASIFGADAGVNYSRSYSGDWNKQTTGLDDLIFEGYSPSDPVYEPVYYKSSGEMTASPTSEMDYLDGSEPIRFDLHNTFDASDGIVPAVGDILVNDYLDNSPLGIASNRKRTTRQKRSQLMTYRTSGQIDHTIGYGHPTVTLYNTANEFPSTSGVASTVDYGNYPGHHIGEVTVYNPDGYRYVYGLPAYNKSQKEVMFTKDFLESEYGKTQPYSSGDNAIHNGNGEDHFFMSTEIPQYAYSYLITAIYSPDYVDLTGDGPTDDDFGYWVKFNYTQVHGDLVSHNYGWRVPFRNANYSKNHLSNVNDDKLSYMYGTKEVYYLNSIETKTHEANFILNNNSTEVRHDGNGAPTEDFLTATALGTANHLRYLKSIELFNKKDPSTPIKTVHFEYDYSLCGGTTVTGAAKLPNNDGSTSDPANSNKGKLTLKKLWFTYRGNGKGQLTPYTFTYSDNNPDYSQDNMDRWGNYMPDQTISGGGNDLQVYGNENPYVRQSASSNNADEYMSSWNLQRISLPSGGVIDVTYESDDYAFVQDKKAMQLQRIVGTGEYTSVITSGGDEGQATATGNKLNDRNTIIFFELERPFNGSSLTGAQRRDSIKPYVENIDQLYFKTFQKLKKKADLSGYSYDYVEGYASIDKNQMWYGYGVPNGSGIISTGWIRVKNEERNPWNPIGQTDHPFKLAGWQYLRLERPDLLEDGTISLNHNSSIAAAILSFGDIINQAQRLFGYFNYCQSRGFCNELYLPENYNTSLVPRPSYLRLNTPDGRKFGGGHRVRQLTITDGWDEMSGDVIANTYTYGTVYSYTLPDGTSSGVAEYEPLIGGEEIPQRVPLRYQERMYPYKNDGLYTEEPFGESLYPAPNVGYSRVVAKSINHEDPNLTKRRSGITVTEFYTAKDFPVITDYTDLKKKNFAIPVIVPFIGEISYNNKGYSQGFSIELNNMHGQLKSQAVYSANADINNPNTQPVSKTEYIYETDHPYDPNHTNHLSNAVQVLDADGVYREADIGKTHEFYIDRQQHSNFSVNAGVQINAGAAPPYTFWSDLFPYFELSYSMYRSISTLKVIERNGVLSEVRNYKDGAYTTSKNLMYDAETGQPLLTQTINDFEAPVYTYNYASHWAYNTMNGAYKNIGAKFLGQSVIAGVLSYTNPEKYFLPGDEVEIEDPSTHDRSIKWVSAVNPTAGTVTFINEDGSTPLTQMGVNLTIVRSAYRNQQVSTNGTIVSLSNPVTSRHFPLFDALNAVGTVDGNSVPFTVDDCVSGNITVTAHYYPSPDRIEFTSAGDCQATVTFPNGSGIDNLSEALDYTYAYSGGTVTATSGTTTLTCAWEDAKACYHMCMDDVLHAEAYSFKDNWDFNYADAGDPLYKIYGGSPTTLSSAGAPNDYRFGKKGVWRMEQGWVYQVDRNQTSSSPSLTKISKDGTYFHFVPFNWDGDIVTLGFLNPQWTLTNTITQYNPFGYEVENKDAIGVYSSALYGYNQSLSTAVASNCRYRELAFDGFEDYTNPSSYTSEDPHGHLHFTSVNSSHPIYADNTESHTGTYSLHTMSLGAAVMDFNVDHSTTNDVLFNPIAGRLYHLSVWVKTSGTSTGRVDIYDATTSTTIATATPDPSMAAIDGWKRIDIDFTAPAASDHLQLELSCPAATSGEAWFDDLRLQPYTSGMKTYVYDPVTYWLVAELDDRNYATFYNYDEEGALVQVKKETEKGIMTLRTSRNSVKHASN